MASSYTLSRRHALPCPATIEQSVDKGTAYTRAATPAYYAAAI